MMVATTRVNVGATITPKSDVGTCNELTRPVVLCA